MEMYNPNPISEFYPLDINTEQDQTISKEYSKELTAVAASAGYPDIPMTTKEDFDNVSSAAFRDSYQEFSEDSARLIDSLNKAGVSDPVVAAAAYKTWKDNYQPEEKSAIYNRMGYNELIKAIQNNEDVTDLFDSESIIAEINANYLSKEAILSSKVKEVNNEYGNQSFAKKLYDGKGHLLTFWDNARLAQMYEGGNSWASYPKLFYRAVKAIADPDTTLQEELELSSIQRRGREFYDALMQDPSISVEQFYRMVEDKDNELKEDGWSAGAREEFWRTIESPDYVTNRYTQGLEVGLVGASAFTGAIKGASGGIKGAIKGAYSGAEAAFPFVPAGIKTANFIASSPIKMAKHIGDKVSASRAVKANRELLNNTNISMEAPELSKEFLEEGFVSALRATDSVDSLQVANEPLSRQAAKRARDFKAVEEYINTLGSQFGGLAEEAKQALINNYAKEISSTNRLPEYAFQDLVRLTTKPNRADWSELTVKMGRGENWTQSFRTFKEADAYRKTLKFPSGTRSMIKRDQSGYYIYANTEIKKGIGQIVYDYTKAQNGSIKTTYGTDLPFLFDKLWKQISTKGTVPTTINELNALFVQSLGSSREILRQFVDSVRKLQSSEKDLLDSLINLSRHKQRFINTDELINRGFSQKIADAYDKIRTLEDISWTHLNKARRTELDQLGYNSISSEDISFFGREIDLSTTWLDNKYVVDIKGNVVNLTKDVAKAYKNKGYSLYHTMQPINRSEYVLIKNETKRVNKLPQIVIGYKPGFRHLYADGTNFLKQSNTINGKLAFTQTFLADTDVRALKSVADKLNSVMEIVRKYLSGKVSYEEANDAVVKGTQDSLKVRSLKEFLKEIRTSDNPEGIIDLVNPFEVVADGEITNVAKEYSSSFWDETAEGVMAIKTLNGIVDDNIQSNLKRLRRSCDGLLNTRGVFAAMVDVDDEIDNAINEISRNIAGARYTQIVAENIVNTFGEILESGAVKRYTPSQILTRNARGNRTVISNTTHDPKIARMIDDFDHAVDIYKIMVGSPSSIDLKLDEAFRSLSYAIADSSLANALHLGERGYRPDKIYQSLRKLNPIKAWRALTFNYYLGLFNPRQLHQQALSSINAISMSPIAGSKAAVLTPMIMSSIGKMNKDTYAEAARIASHAAKDPSITSAWWENLVNNVKHLDVYGYGTLSGAFERFGEDSKNWEHASQFFFRTGEMYNRVHAATTAALEYMSKNGNVNFSNISKAELAKILNRQQTLYMNMGRQGVSRLQSTSLKGLGAVLFQMKGFNLRAVEAMAGRELTSAEKWRLGITSMALTGSKGFLGATTGAWLYDLIDSHTDLDDNEVREINEAVFLGGLDYLSKEAGFNISLMNGQSPEYIDNIIDFFGFADGSITDNIALAGVTKKVYGTVTEAWNAFNAYKSDGGNINTFTEAVKQMAIKKNLPSVANRIILAKLAMDTHKTYTSKGLVNEELNNDFEAFLYAFGFDNISTQELNRAYYQLSRKDIVDGVYENLRVAWLQAQRNVSGDEETYAAAFKYFTYLKELQFKELTPKERRGIMNKLYQDLKQSNVPTKSRLLHSILKYQGNAELADRVVVKGLFEGWDK